MDKEGFLTTEKSDDMEKMLSGLGDCALFQHLPEDEMMKLLSEIKYRVRIYEKNEVIFSPHQKADTLGILLEGAVDVQKLFSCGKTVTVNRRFAPDLIADASIFADIQHYPSNIIASEKSRLFLINRQNLLTLFTRNEPIMAKFLQSVSNRVLMLNKSIEILSINSVSSKIAWYLIDQYNEQNRSCIQMIFSKKTLAEHLNVSRTTLSRELKKMEKEGIISFNRKLIQILDIEKLEKFC